MTEASTRERIVEATCRLFRSQGMAGTGLNQIAKESKAPFGSIYHHFPGGKRQITETVIREWGVQYRDYVLAILGSFPDFAASVRPSLAGAGHHLVGTDYADGCPVATVALEVASTDETLRTATAEVFTDWVDHLIEAMADTGLPAEERRRIAWSYLAALEGGFVLCRALRSPEPLVAAGHVLGRAVLDAITANAAEG